MTLRTVIYNAKVLAEDPENYDSRAQVMWASSLSHNGLTGCGTSGDWACHQIEHEIGGMFDVAHGAGLAAVWGSWARYVSPVDYSRFAKFAVNVMDIDPSGKDDKELTLAGIEAMEDFYRSINMPISMKELGVEPTAEQIEDMAYKCTYMGRRTIGGFKVLKKEDIAAIYEAAK